MNGRAGLAGATTKSEIMMTVNPTLPANDDGDDDDYRRVAVIVLDFQNEVR